MGALIAHVAPDAAIRLAAALINLVAAFVNLMARSTRRATPSRGVHRS